MGLGPAMIKLYLELWQRGLFKNVNAVIELGSQELHIPRARFEELVQAAGISHYTRAQFPHLETWPRQPRCPAKPFYHLLGVDEYACIDLNGQHGALAYDLNVPLTDTSLYLRYDLVTDFGAAEHCFNIAETYRTLHRLCRPGGLMVCHQGVSGGLNGYYGFDLSFFEGFAAANDYRVLFCSYVLLPRGEPVQLDDHHIPLSRELLDTIDPSKVRDISICYVLQKQGNADFRFPYQGLYLSASQGHQGYELAFLQNPPSRAYVPVSEWRTGETLRTPVLVRLLLHRARRILSRLIGRRIRRVTSGTAA